MKGKKMKTIGKWLVAVLGMVGLSGLAAKAQVVLSTNLPDPSPIANAVQAPFNTTLAWVIGVLSVLAVISYILLALRKGRSR